MKTLCITLPESPERTQAAKAHFRERGVKIRFFDGIHGETAGLSTRHPYDSYGVQIGHRHTGICISHYMVWSALNLLDDTHFMVLEDDARFSHDWNSRLAAAMSNTPRNFDMLFIGSCCCEGKPTTKVKGEVFEVKWPACTHAYIVAKKAIPTLLTTQRKIWANIDVALAANSFPRMKVFTVLPRIVGQANMELAK